MTDTQFSTRDVPWMKVGTEIDESVTAEQALELAQLNFDVELRADGWRNAKGNWQVDPSKRKVIRTDTGMPLGTVSPGYEILQYRDAFSFIDGISPEIVAAGGLNDGRQAFVVVRAPEQTDLTVLGTDKHDLYVVLRASHDGSRAIEVNLLPLRGACMNMLPAARFGRSNGRYNSKAKQRWSVRHTKNMNTRLEQARDVLTRSAEYAEEFKAMAEALAAIDLELDQAREVIDAVVPEHLAHPEKVSDAIFGLYETSSTNGFRGNGWGVLNAVTEYYDHFRGGADRAPTTRWVQGLDGTTTRAINRTIEVLRSR